MDETKCAYFNGVYVCNRPKDDLMHTDGQHHAFVAPAHRGEEKRYCGQANGCADVFGLHWRGCSGAEPPAPAPRGEENSFSGSGPTEATRPAHGRNRVDLPLPPRSAVDGPEVVTDRQDGPEYLRDLLRRVHAARYGWSMPEALFCEVEAALNQPPAPAPSAEVKEIAHRIVIGHRCDGDPSFRIVDLRMLANMIALALDAERKAREDAEKWVKFWKEERDVRSGQLAEAEARERKMLAVVEAQEDLLEYRMHEPGCAVREAKDCTCGFDEAQARLSAAKEALDQNEKGEK